MKLSYNWLLEYLPKPLEINNLSTILTAIGLEVEGIEISESVKGGLQDLVIGEVKSCIPHPNADKLKLTTVDIGQENLLSIVCGAPNVAVGQKVVVATIGTTIHPLQGDPFLIKKAKIRGEASEGMICGESEISLGEDRSGIIILPENASVGTLVKDYYQLPDSDFTIEIGLTPNRSDANSHLGVAKDVCAYLNYHEHSNDKVVSPNTELPERNGELPIAVQIKNEEACPRYAGIAITDITIGPSPDWLKERLIAIDIHPINNVVDITNFVLHEYGQPLHAFDYDEIEGSKIIVQNAKQGQKFITLDEKERSLSDEDLMICDTKKAMVIAGVFGGLHSGITAKTKNIFLESAYFIADGIRKSSLRHGLRTEAATHYEKGVSMEAVLPALKRAASLIVKVAGGQIASSVIDIFPLPFEERIIQLKYNYLHELCGKIYAPEKVKEVFQSLGFRIVKENEHDLLVGIPGENLDIHQAADLVEEVLRIDGLDHIKIPTRLNISLQAKAQKNNRALRERIANYLASAGFNEIMTNSLTNSKYYPDNKQLVRLINNLSVELDVLRPSMLESGLEVILHNANRKMPHLRLFEFGKTYQQIEVGQYKETELLAFWLSGNRNNATWNQKAVPATEFDLKGTIDAILKLSGASKVKSSIEDNQMIWKRGKDVMARSYRVSDQKTKEFDIRQNVFYAEINVQLLGEAIQNTRVQYKELPKFPSMKRDLALVVDQHIPFEKINGIAKTKQWPSLKNYELFDVFVNEKLGENKKSLALSFTFQLNDRTLTDQEVDKMMQELISTYEKELNALVRS